MEPVAQPTTAGNAVSERLGVAGCVCQWKPGRCRGACSPSGCLTLLYLEQDQQDRREGNLGTGTLPIRLVTRLTGQVCQARQLVRQVSEQRRCDGHLLPCLRTLTPGRASGPSRPGREPAARPLPHS